MILMRKSLQTGITFGLTSGTITTLGLMVGLSSSTNSAAIVIGGILTIAIADALSDALGMHISKESARHSAKYVWEATVSTFGAKFIYGMTFVIPFLVLGLESAVIICIIWGLIVLSTMSYKIGKSNQENPWKAVTEHLLVALIVIIVTHYIGLLIVGTFG